MNYSSSQRIDGEEKFGGLLFQYVKRGFDIKLHIFVGAKWIEVEGETETTVQNYRRQI